MKKLLLLHSLAVILMVSFSCNQPLKQKAVINPDDLYSSCKPYTRWWWFASIIDSNDIKYQLDWVKSQGFGGVEIAWIYPVNRNPDADRTPWLGREWTKAVAFTKKYADHIGMGCDFTFGTLWPFGGTFVSDQDATKVFADSSFRQPLRLSWTHPDTGNVLNHMNKNAFERYAGVMGDALKPALEGSTSGLFCDSWEVETHKIWTEGFDSVFIERYGYDIKPYMNEIYSKKNKDERYDYMKLVAEYVRNNFYTPFNEKCHELGAFSRVQCAGSPTDLITVYSEVDVPETEAMLYNTNFSRIVASAATLGKKPIVSSETFTCLYGWPGEHFKEEKITDLKLVADALFANGVNQIIWHGMPYNPIGSDSIYFYATVHVGKNGSLSKYLKSFNQYLTKISEYMREGVNYSDVAVYLPLEDSWIAGVYPDSLQMPWSWGAYELRYEHLPDELIGYQPLWINQYFLEKGELVNGQLVCGDAFFKVLYVDVDYLDYEALKTILKLAENGFPVCIKKVPAEPGKNKHADYESKMQKLLNLECVATDFKDVYSQKPLIQGNNIPDYWCRQQEDTLTIFFAHPFAQDIQYPLEYGFSETKDTLKRNVVINFNKKSIPVELKFRPYQSVLLQVKEKVVFKDVEYHVK